MFCIDSTSLAMSDATCLRSKAVRVQSEHGWLCRQKVHSRRHHAWMCDASSVYVTRTALHTNAHFQRVSRLSRMTILYVTVLRFLA